MPAPRGMTRRGAWVARGIYPGTAEITRVIDRE
jgi:hypothetical protein